MCYDSKKEEKLNVIDLVRKAFRGVVLGNGRCLREAQAIADYEDEDTLAQARTCGEKNTDWSDLTDLELQQSSLGVFSLDKEGTRFYLPAFLVAELEGVELLPDMVFFLTYDEDSALSRFDLLNQLQREAVIQFLLINQEGGFEKKRHLISNAIKSYWASR